MQRIHVIDSHTGGEPTRVVIDGGPDLGDGPLAERLAIFRDPIRCLPLRDRRRTTRLGRAGRRAADVAGRFNLRGGCDLLQ